MTLFDLIILIVQLSGIILGAYFLIKTIIIRKKIKDYVEKLKKQYSENEKILLENKNLIIQINERSDLLSRENVKLISQNEELKDRLRNLGIKDFDVIK